MTQFQQPAPAATATGRAQSQAQRYARAAEEAQREQASGVQRQPDLPSFVSHVAEQADREPQHFIGDRSVPTRPSFAQAVSGIEDGDYEGLEMLDFGSLEDGTPSVAFRDEDGQQQVIRLTVPQWAGMIEARSRARQQVKQARALAQKTEKFYPHYKALLQKVAAAQAPETVQYLDAMYQLDPEAAIQTLGDFVRARPEEMVPVRGNLVPKRFAADAYQLEKRNYDGTVKQYESIAQGLKDKPFGMSALQGVLNMHRTPDDLMAPSSTTLIDNLEAKSAGPLPLQNLVRSMSIPGLVPMLQEPVALPAPGADGIYPAGDFLRFFDQFNSVSQAMGWGPVLATDENGILALVDALNAVNRRGPAAPGQAQAMSPSAEVKPVAVQQEEVRQRGQDERASAKSAAAPAGSKKAGGFDTAAATSVVTKAAEALGMDPGDAAGVTRNIVGLAREIRRRQETNDWNGFAYDAKQRSEIIEAEAALRSLYDQRKAAK